MKIYSVLDPEFKKYGRVLEGYHTEELIRRMKAIQMPEHGVRYLPMIAELEETDIFDELKNRGFGGLTIELGMCWGYNTKLNCLEYHKSSEINIGEGEFILLLARQEEIEEGRLATEKIKAFRVPAEIPVELYATTLHYAPCCGNDGKGFRVAVVLPRGTNLESPVLPELVGEDGWLRARNKWLIAHEEAEGTEEGVYIGLFGKNLDLSEEYEGI